MGFLTLACLVSFCFLGKARLLGGLKSYLNHLLYVSWSAEKLPFQAGLSWLEAAARDGVQLKCMFPVDGTGLDLRQLTVLWFHQGNQLVEFEGEVATMFRQGVRLSQEELGNGKASRFISQVDMESSSIYRCYVTYLPELYIREVNLHVVGVSANSEDDSEDLFSPPLCLGCSSVLNKLDQMSKSLKQREAKLQGLANQTSTKCSNAVSQQPLH